MCAACFFVEKWPSTKGISGHFPQKKTAPHTSLSHYNAIYQITRNSRIVWLHLQPLNNTVPQLLAALPQLLATLPKLLTALLLEDQHFVVALAVEADLSQAQLKGDDRHLVVVDAALPQVLDVLIAATGAVIGRSAAFCSVGWSGCGCDKLSHGFQNDAILCFLAPPAERQRSFSNTDLSVVRLSVCLSVCPSVCPSVKIEGGRGLSQKRFSNFSSFLAWTFFGVT